MKRRTVLASGAAVVVAAGLGMGLALRPPGSRTAARVQTLAQARAWVQSLGALPAAAMRQGWPLAAVLEHLAQSIEFSMSGFPEPKPAWFQTTVGAAAFAAFKANSRMRHGLTEPIPGAPALAHLQTGIPANAAQAIATTSARLLAAISAFEAHTGPLKPHFAYGFLSKPDHALAHALHMDNHLDELA